MLFLLLPKHHADLLHIVYVSITLSGTEYFLEQRSKVPTGSLQKLVKITAKGGKKYQNKLYPLIQSSKKFINFLEGKLLTPKCHGFFTERAAVQECHFPFSYWVEFKVDACESLAN